MAGTGSGSTTIHLSVPSSIAATSIPDGTAGAHDGVYEMKLTVKSVPPAPPYDQDEVSLTGQANNPTVICDYSASDPADYTCESVHGRNVLSTHRPYNGDVCVIPGGETPWARGTLAAITVDGGAKYTGRFGGIFLNDDGATPTSANFRGRKIREALTPLSVDECFFNAVEAGADPTDMINNYDVRDVTGVTPTQGIWEVSNTDGTWSTCFAWTSVNGTTGILPQYSVDSIGYVKRYVDFYLDTMHGVQSAHDCCPGPEACTTAGACTLNDPNGDGTGCGLGADQAMWIECRLHPDDSPPWGWAHKYKDFSPLAITLWDDGATIRYQESCRHDTNTCVQADYGWTVETCQGI